MSHQVTARQSLSLIVITKNEEHCIERCLRSVDADEIIVVDSGSTDRTVEIARAAGARVVIMPDWPGFGPQKSRALALATGDWVLSLDADEWINPEFGGLIRDAINAPDAPAAYQIVRHSRFCGKTIKFGSWSSDWLVRLFKRGQARFSDHIVHEGIVVDGQVRRISVSVDHDSIESWSDAEDKIERYSKAAAQRMISMGRRASPLSAPLHGIGTFLRVYVLFLGFLDGAAGFGSALYTTRYSIAKWRRVAEYSKRNAGQSLSNADAAAIAAEGFQPPSGSL